MDEQERDTYLRQLPGWGGGARHTGDLARRLIAEGDPLLAATVADLAHAAAPRDERIAFRRQELLDRLAVREHGLVFRYVPGGTFLMGSTEGDPDEQPVHEVQLSPFWIADAPLSWADWCRLLDWEPPPRGMPRHGARPDWVDDWLLHQRNKILFQYCLRECGADEDGEPGAPGEPRPMVAVTWSEAVRFCQHLSAGASGGVRYRLPTEAEWEKAARGGLHGARYAWGNQPPGEERCDFNHFGRFELSPSRALPPNGYGLYGMCGGVWEWTLDRYDARYYAQCPGQDPMGPTEGQQRVLHGGSWADCARAVTVSFRSALPTRSRTWQHQLSPNIGFRICRVAR